MNHATLISTQQPKELDLESFLEKNEGLYTADQILSMKFPPKEWLLQPILLRKGTAILSGQVKLGKSYLFLSIFIESNTAGPRLNRVPTRGFK